MWCWECSSVRISSFGDLRHWLEAVDPVDVWYPIQSVESSGNGVFNSSPIIRQLDGRMRGQDITFVVDVNCSPYDNTHFLLVWKRHLQRFEISWQCWGHQNRKFSGLLLMLPNSKSKWRLPAFLLTRSEQLWNNQICNDLPPTLLLGFSTRFRPRSRPTLHDVFVKMMSSEQQIIFQSICLW